MPFFLFCFLSASDSVAAVLFMSLVRQSCRCYQTRVVQNAAASCSGSLLHLPSSPPPLPGLAFLSLKSASVNLHFITSCFVACLCFPLWAFLFARWFASFLLCCFELLRPFELLLWETAAWLDLEERRERRESRQGCGVPSLWA